MRDTGLYRWVTALLFYYVRSKTRYCGACRLTLELSGVGSRSHAEQPSVSSTFSVSCDAVLMCTAYIPELTLHYLENKVKGGELKSIFVNRTGDVRPKLPANKNPVVARSEGHATL